MAMLATLEGPETVESDDYILGRMFSPNDGLGVELLGVDGWNLAKSKVAKAAIKALKAKRLFIVPEILYCDATPCRDNLAASLFGIDENYCNELLGFSITKSLKKAASKVAKNVKKASTDPIGSAKSTVKSAIKQVKKYSSPTKALQLSLSPTLQARTISKLDPTGASTAVMDTTYKFAPDVLPSKVAEKSTAKTVKYDPTGISQKLFKFGKKGIKLTDIAAPTNIYKGAKKVTEKKEAPTTTATTTKPEQVQTVEPQVIYQTQYVPVQTETQPAAAAFDWSNILNWKTVLIVGGVAYLVFGRRGSKRK